MLLALAALIAADRPAPATHGPIPDQPLGALLADSDYPADAIRRGVSGTVSYMLNVGPDGAPTRCTITKSADAELDRTTCDIFMARAHFQPRRDGRGRAVTGSVAGRVRWILPDDAERGPRANLAALLSDEDYPAGAVERRASGTVYFKIDVGADGVPTLCTITQSADIELDRTTCDIMMARAHFQPATDSGGHAVAGSLSARVRWVLPTAETGLLPFAAMHVATVLTLDPQGRVTCTSTSNGAPPQPPPLEGECGDLYGTGAAEAIRARAVPGELITIFTMVPEGGAPAPGNEGAGARLLYEDIVQIAFAPDGTVAECQPGPTHIVQPELHMDPPTPCWEIGEHIVVQASGQEMRRAEAR